jgi:hypothetical protein
MFLFLRPLETLLFRFASCFYDHFSKLLRSLTPRFVVLEFGEKEKSCFGEIPNTWTLKSR